MLQSSHATMSHTNNRTHTHTINLNPKLPNIRLAIIFDNDLASTNISLENVCTSTPRTHRPTVGGRKVGGAATITNIYETDASPHRIHIVSTPQSSAIIINSDCVSGRTPNMRSGELVVFCLWRRVIGKRYDTRIICWHPSAPATTTVCGVVSNSIPAIASYILCVLYMYVEIY